MKLPATLPDNLYRDPAKIYEEAEQRTCKGCAWIELKKPSLVEYCAGGEKYGHRCEFYSEKKNERCA